MAKVVLTPRPHRSELAGGSPFGSMRPGGPRMPGAQGGAGYYSFYSGEAWTPSVNLYESERAYIVCVDLAGVDKDKIDIEVQGGVLTLRGRRAAPSDFDPECLEDGSGNKCRVHLMEIDHGAFARSVELPQDADRDKINARYRNGLLWIELPKK